MGFLESRPDLTSTVFSSQDLATAKEVLVSLISSLDADWLETPTGPLGLQWLGEGLYSATFLIHVAQIVYVLDRNVTQRSVPIFRDKLKQILRPPRREGSFEELLSELEAAALLAHRVSPISFEPLVPESAIFAPNKPRSPDYGVRLPDGDVCFEVTNVHIELLESWDIAAQHMGDLINRQVLKKGLRREVSVSASVRASRTDLADLSKIALPRILGEAAGEMVVVLGAHGNAKVHWKSIPHLWVEPGRMPHFPVDIQLGSNTVATFGGAPSPASSVLWNPVINGEEINENVINSIRNSLRSKRKQMKVSMPYILIVRLAHRRMDRLLISHFIHNRLFPNPEYSWMTGIALFVPRRNWESISEEASLLLHINENSRFPPQSLSCSSLMGLSSSTLRPSARPLICVGEANHYSLGAASCFLRAS
ncbi:hypothetical protein HNQ07_001499 [Deinococcus metalli]|uniref:Uncharacterized protein n=1 Tax=Deinococcus metalli TaxID=1141878 RepID=A0A7W8NRE0_9DEIO|nr:hypothetical protein [Deinococcus metalli]MBB5376042.1 hypothetical protein [Deinococcus metalli]